VLIMPTATAAEFCGPRNPALVARLATVYAAVSGHDMALSPTAAGGSGRGHVQSTAACAPTSRSDRVRASPIAWDALAVVTHRDVGVAGITRTQLRAILTGELVNWRQLGGPDRPLELQTQDGPVAGIELYGLERDLFGQQPVQAVPAAVHASPAAVAAAVAANPNAIALMPRSQALELGVRALEVDGARPDYASVQDGSYPLSMPLYLNYPADGPRRTRAEGLLSFAHSAAGRQVIRKLGAVPYLEALHLAAADRAFARGAEAQ
jgi:phosphate transport system substrate-binding protein